MTLTATFSCVFACAPSKTEHVAPIPTRLSEKKTYSPIPYTVGVFVRLGSAGGCGVEWSIVKLLSAPFSGVSREPLVDDASAIAAARVGVRNARLIFDVIQVWLLDSPLPFVLCGTAKKKIVCVYILAFL